MAIAAQPQFVVDRRVAAFHLGALYRRNVNWALLRLWACRYPARLRRHYHGRQAMYDLRELEQLAYQLWGPPPP